MLLEKIRFPAPLTAGSRIAITSPSGGVHPKFHARLDLVLDHFRAKGFKIIEGECLRDEQKHVSAEKSKRAQELMRFLTDDSIDAICPPWGGEVLIEILPLLDFEKISRAKPKWVTSYSDISTLTFALTARIGWATAHTPNLMDLVSPRPDSKDTLTQKFFEALATPEGGTTQQASSKVHQRSARIDFEKDPTQDFEPDTPTEWKSLHDTPKEIFKGRLIGGCLDTISCLTGTPSGSLTEFQKLAAGEGVVFFFENCEGSPTAVVRMLENMKQAGWFDRAQGFLIGRSCGPEAKSENELSYEEALQNTLAEFKLPVIYDADIGHRPPQFSLFNGALTEVRYESGRGQVTQWLR